MKEKFIENYLRELVRGANGLCQKFTSPGTRDVPDDLVTWPWGEMDLVETKQPGGKCRPGQLRDHRERAARGIPVYLLDTPDKVCQYVSGRTSKARTKPRLNHLYSVPLCCECGCENAPGPVCR